MPANRPKYPYDYIPRCAILYCRISDARDYAKAFTTSGVDDQDQRLRDFTINVLGWGILMVLVENDTSAFKRRKIILPDGDTAMRVVRPKFRKALDLLKSGEADGFVAVDLDRALRDPRDLEDMIDIVEERRIPVQSITGSLRLSNDADITMARVMVAMANKSSRDTARRVTTSRETKARAGEWSGGPRSFGFESDGVTRRESEVEVLQQWANGVLQGTYLSRLALESREAGVKTVYGGQLQARTIRQALLRPAMAGRMIYQGEDIGPAPWEPIIPLSTWEAVVEILTDEDRTTSPGPTPKWLGSGLYICGKCGAPMKITHQAARNKALGRDPRMYRCRDKAHLSRSQVALDRYIEDVIVARMAREDAVDLVRQRNASVDIEALSTRKTVLRANLKELVEDRAVGLITREEQLNGARKVKAELARLDELLADSPVDSPLTPLVEAEGIEEVLQVWKGMTLGEQRNVLQTLMTVTVHSARGLPRGENYFNPDAIGIEWNQPRIAT